MLFFLDWLVSYVGERVTPLVIGDLSFQMAEIYYMLKLEELPESLKSKAPPFSEVFEVVGGKMYHIDRYLDQFFISEGQMKVHDADFVKTALIVYKDALNKDCADLVNSDPKKLLKSGQAEWQQDSLLKIMEIISKEKFSNYSDLTLKFGYKTVHSLIRHKLLFYRPTKECTFDLPSVDSNDPILVPPSPVSGYAMKLILEENKK